MKTRTASKHVNERHYFISDSGVANGFFEGSSGSAAAVDVAELLDGASLGPFNNSVVNSDETNKIEENPNMNVVIIHDEVVSARTVRKRRIAGIFQHYYPEGGWGYVILICAFLVQLLVNGLQQSVAILLFPIAQRKYQVTDGGFIGKQKNPVSNFHGDDTSGKAARACSPNMLYFTTNTVLKVGSHLVTLLRP